jgi:hypothetical protein
MIKSINSTIKLTIRPISHPKPLIFFLAQWSFEPNIDDLALFDYYLGTAYRFSAARRHVASTSNSPEGGGPMN